MPGPKHLNEFNRNAGLESKGDLTPMKRMGGIILGWQAKQLKVTAQFAEQHGVGKGFGRKIWRTKESKSLGSRGRLTCKVQSPFDSSNWAKRGLRDSRLGEVYYPFPKLYGFAPPYSKQGSPEMKMKIWMQWMFEGIKWTWGTNKKVTSPMHPPKNDTKQEASKLVRKLSWEWILNKMLGVIGSFWEGGSPWTRLIPVNSNCKDQLPMRGRLNSLCRMPMIFK